MTFHVTVGRKLVVVGIAIAVVVASPFNPTRVAKWLVVPEWFIEFPEFFGRVPMRFVTSLVNPVTSHLVDVDGDKQFIHSVS